MKLPTLLACLMLQPMLVAASLDAASSERIVTGNVMANRSVTLATRIMGRITRVHAAEGDKLTGGQVIVEIDDVEYRAQLKSAEASQDQAMAELAHRKRIKVRLQQLVKTNVDNFALFHPAGRNNRLQGLVVDTSFGGMSGQHRGQGMRSNDRLIPV